MILLHGTTRWRAEQILVKGPDPRFRERGGGPLAESFSTYLESGPFIVGTPEDYAQHKAKLFPNEGDPVILVLDVPDEIVGKADDWMIPANHGVVQFQRGLGLEELLAAWPQITQTAEI